MRLNDTEKDGNDFPLSILDACEDSILITEASPIDDPGPAIVYANEAFLRLTGYGMPEIIGQTPRILQGLATSAKARANIRDALQQQVPIRQEIENYRKDGSLFLVELRIAPVIGKSGVCTHFIAIQRELAVQNNPIAVSDALQFSRAFKHDPLPVYVFDRSTLAFLDANPAAEQAYGWARDELITMSMQDICTPAEASLLRARIATRPGGPRRLTDPAEHLTKSGRRLHVRWIIESIIYGGRDALLVVAWDITPQIEAEMRVAEIGTQLGVILESIQDPLFTLDRDYRICFANQEAFRHFGLARSDITGRSIWDIFPELVGTEVQRKYACVLREARMVHLKFRYPGRDTWFDIKGFPSITGMTVIFRNITEDRRHADILERQAAILNDAPDAIIVCDHHHCVTYWNRRAEQLYGYASEEAIGRPIHQLIYDASKTFDIATAQLMREGRWVGRIIQRAKDGTRLIVQGNWSLIPGDMPETRSVLTINSDIRDRVVLEERLNQSARLDAIGQLTGGVAHDFNNLLTVILGNSELMLEALPESSELRPLVDLTHNAARRGADLTSRLLAFARKQPLSPRICDLNLLVRGMVPLIHRTLGENICVELVCSGDLWPAYLDAAQVEAALLNLAINARDAMQPQGGRLLIETMNGELEREAVDQNSDAQPGQYALIAVTDTGCGMSPEVLSRVFEPFFTTKRASGGSGLGLSMIFGFMRQSGGQVRIYSEPGVGTTVRLYFPRAFASAEARVPKDTMSQNLLQGRGETILAVEDNELVRQQVRAQLESLDYHVVCASNGHDALRTLNSPVPVDLLFTDVVMPGGISGSKLAEEALRLRPGLKILFTSGYTENALADTERLLQKPYTRQNLAMKVRGALDA